MTCRHMILALGIGSWGRAAMACTLADELTALGDSGVLLASENCIPLLKGSSFKHDIIPNHMGPFLKLYLDEAFREHCPDSLILSDFFNNTNYLSWRGADPEILLRDSVETFSLDVWDFSITGYEIDVFQDDRRLLVQGDHQKWSSRFADIKHKLRPVPIITPITSDGGFNNIPGHWSKPGPASKLHAQIGLPAGAKAVLFCTATWQHAEYESEAGRRMAQSLPRLLADFLAAAGDQVHLVHVGPKAYPLSERMAGRYHWLPALSPGDFDALLASMDLLLSANISATTITKAMVLHVPVLVVENSVAAGSLEQAMAALPHPPSALLESWLRQSLPLFPFSLWPLGYHRFLTPVLRNNPYVDALERVEMLDEATMRRTLATLLFDSVAREEHCHRQQIYLDKVRSLPSGAQCVRAGLAN